MVSVEQCPAFKTRVDGGIGWVLPDEPCHTNPHDRRHDAVAALCDHIANPAVSTIVLVDFPGDLLIDQWGKVSERLWHSSKTLIMRRKSVRFNLSTESQPPGYIEPLTEREGQVLSMASQGASARTIAQRLFISERTVESHISNGYRKLGIRSRIELVRRAVEFGF